MTEMDRAKARRFLVAALGALCACGAWGCSSRDDPKTQRPVAWFPRGTTAEPGRVNCSSRRATALFPLVNKGTRTLRVSRLRGSCACADASIDRASLQPGERTTIRIIINPVEVGEKSTTVEVTTNDPLQPTATLVVAWEGVAPFSVAPAAIDFGELRPAENSTRAALVTWNEPVGRTDWIRTIKTHAQPQQHLLATLAAARLPEAGGDGTGPGATLLVTLTAGSDHGNFSGLVRVQSASPGGPFQDIPVTWSVADAVRATPARLYLELPRGAARFQGRLVLSCRDGCLELPEWRMEPGAPLVDVRFERRAARLLVATIEGDASGVSGVASTRLTMRFAEPPGAVVEVPCFFVAAGGKHEQSAR